MKSFRYSVNRHGKNKDWNFEILTVKFVDIEGNLETLQENIRSGSAICSLLGGKRKLRENFQGAQLPFIDIDNSQEMKDENGKIVKDADGKVIKIYLHQLTIAEALEHPIVQKYGALIYTTSSHGKRESASPNGIWEKFRIVFVLPEVVKDPKIFEAIVGELLEILPGDPACKSAVSVFYGSTKAEFPLVNKEAVLPYSFIQRATEKVKEEQRERTQHHNQSEVRVRHQKEANGKGHNDKENWDSVQWARHLCDYIDPEPFDWSTWRYCLLSFEGAGLPEEEVRSWSARSSKHTEKGFNQVWRYIKSSNIFGVGTLWRCAESQGWTKQLAIDAGWKSTPDFKLVEPKIIDWPKLLDDNKVYIYKKDDRLLEWYEAFLAGFRHILDNSSPGTGKSHDCGKIDPDVFDLRQLIYLSPQHRNPTTDTLRNGWTDLEARHNGLTLEDTVNGGKRLKRASNGDRKSIPANCDRTELINSLRNKNISGADSSSNICQACPSLMLCQSNEGQGINYLRQRKEALAATKMRSHPDSLPIPKKPGSENSSSEYDYSNSITIWDETADTFRNTRSIKVTRKDVDLLIAHLVREHSDLYKQLEELLTEFIGIIDDPDKGLYGLDHKALLKRLVPPLIDPKKLEEILNPSLDFLSSRAELASSTVSSLADEKLLKQWLPDLIRILQGERGALHAQGSTIKVTLPDNRHQEIAYSAKANIFLDATLTRQELALKLGCSPDEIYVCKQEEKKSENLTLIQIVDLGRMGMQRGNDQERRKEALIKHYKELDPNAKVFDFLKNNADGAWWRDSRGVNDFIRIYTLILVGTPCRNLADLKAEWACLTGAFPEDDNQEFSAWVDLKIRADIIQAIGRLRANLEQRENDKLCCILITDFDTGLDVQRVNARDITPEAGSKVEIKKNSVKDAISQLQSQGNKVTQKAVAGLTDLSQGYISKCFGDLIKEANQGTQKNIPNANKTSNSKRNNFEFPHSDQDQVSLGQNVVSINQRKINSVIQDLASLETSSNLAWFQITLDFNYSKAEQEAALDYLKENNPSEYHRIMGLVAQIESAIA